MDLAHNPRYGKYAVADAVERTVVGQEPSSPVVGRTMVLMIHGDM